MKRYRRAASVLLLGVSLIFVLGVLPAWGGGSEDTIRDLLTRLLANHDDTEAMESLVAEIDTGVGLSAAISIYQSADDNWAKYFLIKALKNVDDASVVPTLLQALNEGLGGERIMAARALQKFADNPMVSQAFQVSLNDELPVIRKKSVTGLFRSGVSNIVDLVGSKADDPDESVRYEVANILNCLESLPGNNFDIYRQFLQSPNAWRKLCSSKYFLAEDSQDGQKARAAISYGLDSSRRTVRVTAAAYLKHLPSSNSITWADFYPLFQKAITHSDETVRLQAVVALKDRQYIDGGMTSELIDYLEDENLAVRNEVFLLLRSLNSGSETDLPRTGSRESWEEWYSQQ